VSLPTACRVEQEFNKLAPEQQQQVLGKIKKMMMEMH